MKRIALVAIATLALASAPSGLAAAHGSTSHPRSAVGGGHLVRDPSGHLVRVVPGHPAPGHRSADPTVPPPATATTSGVGGSGCAKETHKIGTTSSTLYYCRAGAYQWVNSAGAAVSMPVWQPAIAQGDIHSLGELAVESDTNTTIGTDNQVVEIGWRVAPSYYGDTLPHLFIYYWVNGVAAPTTPSGDCYKGCTGYVQSTATTTKPGMALASGMTGGFAIDYSGGNWWLYYNGDWFGYFKGSLWNGTYTKSNLVQLYGEVASTVQYPCTHMGDGLYSSDPNAARMTGVAYYSADAPTSLSKGNVDDPWLYDATVTSPTSFNYGGPGNC